MLLLTTCGAPPVLAGLSPPPIVSTVLIAPWGGTGAGAPRGVGLGVALGLRSLDATENVKQNCQKKLHNNPT